MKGWQRYWLSKRFSDRLGESDERKQETSEGAMREIGTTREVQSAQEARQEWTNYRWMYV